MTPKSPFTDLLVIELASALAGPSVGMFFSELGARVIKIENSRTKGDVTRRWKHPLENQDDPYSSYYFCTNWHKESLMLDLRDEAARQTVYEFIRIADIVISNFKKDSAFKVGMDYNTLRSINPSLIYAHITAYGDSDSRPGFDALMQAETGWMSMNGAKDGPPTKVPLPIIDLLAGHQLKEGILTALLMRHKSGEGCKVDVSLYDAGIATLANQAATYLNLHQVPQRMGSHHPSIAPYGEIVTTLDLKEYILAIGTNHHFKALCMVLNINELTQDDRFKNNQQRQNHRIELTELLQREVGRLNAQKFESSCKDLGVPIGAIRDLRQVFEEESAQSLVITESRGDHPQSKRVKTVVFKISP